MKPPHPMVGKVFLFHGARVRVVRVLPKGFVLAERADTTWRFTSRKMHERCCATLPIEQLVSATQDVKED